MGDGVEAAARQTPYPSSALGSELPRCTRWAIDDHLSRLVLVRSQISAPAPLAFTLLAATLNAENPPAFRLVEIRHAERDCCERGAPMISRP
jgi:hypothetical protein